MDIENSEETRIGSSRSGRKRRRRSILKSSPSRQALADVDDNRQDDTEPTTTEIHKRGPGKRRRSSKRVSFANTHEVKEFMKEKDARELGILESSVDESALSKRQGLAVSGVSTGPGHSIKGLDTLLTAPIVHHAQQPDSTLDVQAEEISEREAQVEFKLTPQNFPEPSQPEPQMPPIKTQTMSEFFRMIAFQDDEECEELSDKTILYSDQGDMEMTGSYDPTIHHMTHAMTQSNHHPQLPSSDHRTIHHITHGMTQSGHPPWETPSDHQQLPRSDHPHLPHLDHPQLTPLDHPQFPLSVGSSVGPSVTDEVTQQIYCDNLGLLGPTYTCRIPSWDSSSETLNLHGSSISNASSLVDGSSALREQQIDATRMFTSDDVTGNMEMTGCIQELEGTVASSKASHREQGDMTRVFTSEDMTGNMDMTGCIQDMKRTVTALKAAGHQKQGDMTRVFAADDMTGNMDMTGCIRDIKRTVTASKAGHQEQRDMTRLFTAEDMTGNMEMTGCIQDMGKRVLASKAGHQEQSDMTRVFTADDMTGNMDMTECIKDMKRMVTASKAGHREQREMTRVFTADDMTGNMDMTGCIQQVKGTATASKNGQGKQRDMTRVFTAEDMTGNMDLTGCIQESAGTVAASEAGHKELMTCSRNAPSDERRDVGACVQDRALVSSHGRSGVELITGCVQEHMSKRGTSVGVFDSLVPSKPMVDEDMTVVNIGGHVGHVDLTENLAVYADNEGSVMLADSADVDERQESLKRIQIPPNQMNDDIGVGDVEASDDETSPDLVKSLMSSWLAAKAKSLENSQINDSSCGHIENGGGAAKARMEVISSSAKKQLSDLASQPAGIEHGDVKGNDVPLDPTLTMADIPVIPREDGPLDSTHIYSEDHMGRRSIFFPSSAIKSGVPKSAPVVTADRNWDSTDKVIERNKSFQGSTEKSKKALEALKSLSKSSSKAKVGLFQERPPSVISDQSDAGKNKLPRFPASFGDGLKSTTELHSSLLDSTGGMKYSSMTLNDDLLDSTQGKKVSNIDPGSLRSMTSGRRQTMEMASSDAQQQQSEKVPITRRSPVSALPENIPSRKPEQISAAERHTKVTGREKVAGIEMTDCPTNDLQNKMDKERDHGETTDDHTKRFSNEETAGMEMTAPIASGHLTQHDTGTEPSKYASDDHTQRFDNEEAGGMELTACITSNLRSRLGTENTLSKTRSDGQIKTLGIDEAGMAMKTRPSSHLHPGLDKENTPPHIVSGQEWNEQVADARDERTVRFDNIDDAGMEMTTCLTAGLQSMLDKENMAPRIPVSKSGGLRVRGGLMSASSGESVASLEGAMPHDPFPVVEEHTMRFASDAGDARMEMTTCVPASQQEPSRRGTAEHQITSMAGNQSDQDNQTRRFNGDECAGMEMTACLTANLQNGINKENTTYRQDSFNTIKSKDCSTEDYTQRFGGRDDAQMETTTCVPSSFESQSNKGKDLAANVVALEEHTQRFVGGDAGGGMEMTACISSSPQDEIDKTNVPPRGKAEITLEKGPMTPQYELTKRFGKDDCGGMEMTSCSTSNLQTVDEGKTKLGKVTSTHLGESHGASEDHTTRFGDGVGMEMTTCLDSSRQMIEEKPMSGIVASTTEEHTKRFADADMEMTSCMTANLSDKGISGTAPAVSREINIGDAGGFESMVSSAHGEHTVRFGTGSGMEMTACITSSLPSMCTSATVPTKAAGENDRGLGDDQTRHFGSEDTGKMEMTSCLPSGPATNLLGLPRLSKSVDHQKNGSAVMLERSGNQCLGNDISQEYNTTGGIGQTGAGLTTSQKADDEAMNESISPSNGKASGMQDMPLEESQSEIMELSNVNNLKTKSSHSHSGLGKSPLRKKAKPSIDITDVGSQDASDRADGDQSKRRDSDTFILEKSMVPAPHIDDKNRMGQDGKQVDGNSPSSAAVGFEGELQRAADGGGLSFPANIWDTSMDGIMEEEFMQSPDCTEDLENVVLSQPATSKALNLSQFSTLGLETVKELSMTSEDNKDGTDFLPDDLSLIQFLEMFQDGSNQDANFGRETVLGIDLGKPEELEQFLRVYFITKPDQEIHEWAITQIKNNLARFEADCKWKESQQLKDKCPKIFEKLKDPTTRDSTYDALKQLYRHFGVGTKKEFLQWNYKMKTTLVDGLKYDLRKMSQKVEKSSEGLMKIDQRMENFDKEMLSIDEAITKLQDTVLPTEEDIEEYGKNEKELSDWSKANQQQQDAVKDLKKEKLDVMSRKEGLTKQVKELEADLSGFDEANSEEREAELEDLRNELEALEDCIEWKLKESSPNSDKLYFTFMFGTMDLQVEYGTDSDQPTSLRNISFESCLSESADQIAKLTHRLILKFVDVPKLKEAYGTYASLPVMLQLISREVIKARCLEEEIRQFDSGHLTTVEDCCLHLEFSSVEAHTQFFVDFDLNNFSSGQISAVASHEIGISKLDGVQKILAKMKPGYGQLKRTVQELDKLLKAPTDNDMDIADTFGALRA